MPDYSEEECLNVTTVCTACPDPWNTDRYPVSEVFKKEKI
jgi:hypothetical protein